MNKWMMSAAIAVATLAMASAAQAKQPVAAGQKAGGMFANLDANKDGVVTKAEFLTRHEKRFKVLDADGDGKLTQAEFQPKQPAKAAAAKAKKAQ